MTNFTVVRYINRHRYLKVCKNLQRVIQARCAEYRLELRVSRTFSLPVAAPTFQAMDTQLKALPTLAVLARTVSGCLNSAFLGLF